jgi:hypothetical protein
VSAHLCFRAPPDERSSWPPNRQHREELAWAVYERASPVHDTTVGHDRLATKKRVYCTLNAYRKVAVHCYANQERRRRRGTISPAVRRRTTEAWEAAGRHCGICEAVVESGQRIALDHIVPMADGGTHDEDNLRVTHFVCNARRGPGRGFIGHGYDNRAWIDQFWASQQDLESKRRP